MKSINRFICESEEVKQPSDVVLHFKNNVCAFFYKNTFDYEITDGKYSNAKPDNHSEWVDTSKIVVDGNEYYTASFPHSKNDYSFINFAKYIKDSIGGSKKYKWAIRLLDDARLIKAVETLKDNLDLTTKKFPADQFSNIAYIFGEALRKNKDASFNDTKELIGDWGLRVQQSNFYSEKYFNAFKEESYSIDDFKIDIKSMCKTINTFKYKYE